MIYQDRISYKHGLLLLAMAGLLPAQTTINVNSTVVQSPVKRFGINLGTPNFYDSGQMTKNLVYTTNPSFEGEIYQSLIQCAGSGTATSCSDVNLYTGFPTGFWNNASYTMITGTSAGRSGSICSFTGPTYPQNGGVYTFCDSGTPPAAGDYMLVKTTMPRDVGWPLGGDWLTTVGAGTFTAETTDLPPGTTGKQSGLLTAPAAGDSVSVNMFFDATAAKSFIQLNGSYVLTFKAKGVSGNMNVGVSLTRGANTFITQTQPLTSSWGTYTIPFTGTENGSALTKVKLSFTAAGPDTIEIDDVSLTKSGTDPTNTTIFRDEVVQALQAVKPGVLRYWVDQLGDSLDNMLAPATGRQRSAYTPYAGFDGNNITFVGGVPSIGTYQNQSLKVGLTEFLQLAQFVGADPWIVVPSTFTTGEAYSLIDYLAGGSNTPYGAIRIASGQTAPWTSVFNVIHLEFGNEEWNGGTFKGGALESGFYDPSCPCQVNLSYSPYGVRAQAIFASVKGNPGYSHSKFDLIINGQSASPYSNYFTQLSINNNDSFSIAPYMMYNINEWSTVDKLFGSTFAEAEAFVTAGATSEGVGPAVQYSGTLPYITAEQVGTGKPIVTSEMNLSPTGTPPSGGDGSLSQAAMNGYASSIGSGLAVLDSMFQQLRAGVLTQNLFALPGWNVSITNSNTHVTTTGYLWGAVVDMGVTNLKRPQYLALQMANNAIGNKAQMLQTQHTGLDPTDTQYNFGLNSVTLPTFHFLQSFAFTDGAGNYSLVVFNVNPDNAETINFGGVHPSGTVNVQQLTSLNITDTNETSSVVNIQSIPFVSTMTLPPFSMTTFTWGGSVQAGPAISNVTAANVTANSATITWTTDQAASSQVNYGATTSYGSQSALNSTLTTSHSVTLTGLTAGATYDFDVVSSNSSNASTTSSNSTFTTPAAAPTITGVTATAISSNSATIAWTTDQAATSQVNYGATASYGSQSPLNSTLTTTHSVTLTGLTAATTYNYDVVSANSGSQSSTSANFTFLTTSTGPVITAVTATSISATSATITWTTDQSSSGQVNYGATTAYGSQSPLNSTLTTTHSVTLTGLTAATTYNFDVVSANAANASATSPNATFATTTATSPVISAVTATSITATSATITWTTDLASSSLVNYGTTTAYGSASTLNSTLVTSHSVTLTGLTASTAYNYDVVSVTGASGSATSPNFTFSTTAATAPVISAVNVTAITTTSATINWTTDQTSSSLVNYGTTTAYGSASTLNPALVTAHSVTLTGLTAGTTYNFDVVSANASSVSGTSPNATFATSAAGAPVISNVSAYPVGSTTANINWVTDVNATSVVNFGLTAAYGQQANQGSTVAIYHSLPLSALSPGTTYHFSVSSANAANATSSSTDSSFTTTGTPAAPTISAVAVSAIGPNSATITWNTDQASTTQVAYGSSTSYGSASTLSTALTTAHSVTLTGLTASSAYNFAVMSSNISSLTATSANGTFNTTGPGPVLSAITATAITPTSATITWTTDQASSSLVNYGTTAAYGSASTLNSTPVTTHSVTLTGLTAGTTYNYDVVSALSGGASSTSANFTFATTSLAPPVISAVTATPVSSTSATITWTTDQPSTSLVNYGTTTSYGSQSALSSTLVTSHSVTLTGLTQSTTYNFDVVSGYAAGTPTTSPNATFTTPQTPPVISAVIATSITATSATITWTTDQASNSQVSYGTTTSYGSLSPLNSTLTTTHSVTLTGLTSNTTYNYVAVSGYASGTPTFSGNFTFTTTNATPPVISGVTSASITQTSATISWTTDLASSSLVNYGTTTAYGSASTLNPTLATTHSVTLTGLTAGTTYNYDVVSVTGAGGSATSGNFTFSTPAATAPVISAITVTAITQTSATINWATLDQVSTSLVNYGTTTAYGSNSTLNSTMVNNHSVTLTGLTAGTIYNFDVVSAGVGNVSSTSPNGTFTTLSAGGPAIGSISAFPVTTNTASINWVTDVNSTSVVNFGLTPAYGQQVTQGSSLAIYHAVPLSALSPGTTYHFSVTSANASNATSSSTDSTFTTAGTPAAPTISTVVVSAITNNSATITWTTDQSSSTQVAYGAITSYGSTSTLVPALTTTHSVTLTGLTQGTTYNFAALSANISGLLATSANATFTTTGTAPAPVISAVSATSINSTSATITWTTDQASTSLVNYGTTTAYGSQSALNSTLATAHSVTLTGLTPGTAYNFDVVSANSSSLSATSPNATFSTTALPAPVISAVTATSITTTSATITWTTDQATSSQVNYGTTTAYGSQSALNSTQTTTHAVTLTGLTPGTTYNFDVVSTNSSNLSATSSNATFTTTAVAPVISAVNATSVTTTSATITWTTDQPASSQVNYGTTTAYGSQSALISLLTTSHSVTLTGLTPGTTYNFDVVSANSSNLSATSSNATFTTTANPPVISAVNATAITTTSATITWTTDQPTTSQVNYGTTTNYGLLTALNSALTTTHSVTLTGLIPSTTYNYDVVSGNSSNTSTTSANFTFTTTTNPPVISAVTAASITTTSATITWTTDQVASSQVNYGTTTAYGSQSALNSTLTTAHSVTLTGLTPGTTYNFDVVSANSTNVSATSSNATFTTTAVAPVISAVTATSITATSATITWSTDQAASSQVNYGTTTAYGSQSALNSTLATTHSVTLTGLTPGTTYNFDVVSANSASLSATSTNSAFTTTAVPPVISAVATTSITTTSATIAWTTDQATSSLVNYGATTAYGSQSALNSTLTTTHSVTLTGLTPGTAYNFDVVSTNGSSLSATSSNATFTTTANPPVISAVTSTSITPTSATITWTTDQATSSLVNYGTTAAYGSQSTLNSSLVTTHSVTLTGLTPTTTYNFDVVSANSTNISATSGNFTFTTTTPPPPVISAVTATSITQNSATITWTTDQPSTSLVSYGATTAYGSQSALNSSLVTIHSVTITGLSGGTTYNFAATSGYATGTPATSGNFTFATLITPPPVISSVASYPVANTTATILWTTDVNSTSQVNYGTTTAYGSQTPLVTTLGLYHNVPLSNLAQGTTYHYQVISTNSSGGTTTSADFSFTTSGTSPLLFTSVTATGITSNSATITWTTNQASSSQVYYGTTTAYGTLSTLNAALVTAHSVTFTGLTAGTTYNYEVLSNTATQNGASTNFTFTTSAAGPPVISAVTATPLNATSATIAWTTDQPSTSQVSYGTTTAYGSQSALNSTLLTSHSVTLTGLTPGTTYNYAVISTNSGNMTTTSTNSTFTSPTGAAAVISGVTATSITATSATIAWTTDQPTTSLVNYGTTAAYGSQSTLVTALSTTHAVTLTGLTPGTTYNFDVVSANSSNTATTSGNFTLTTLTAAGPVISSVATWPVAATTATVLWATDVNATSVVNYGTTTAYGQTSGPSSALAIYHAVPLSGLTQGTTYNFQIVTANAAGVTTTSPNYTFTTSGTAPIVFSAVTATGITANSATITWTTNLAGTSQVAYGTTLAYGSLSALNSTQAFTHSVTLTGLTPATTYNFAALSTNSSTPNGASGNFTFTTTGGGPAPVISVVTATSITSTSATITWTTDQASSSLVNFGATTAYGSQSALNSSLVTAHSVTITGLTPGTTYNYDVVSANASNTSATSGNFTFATTAAAAPVISSVTTTSITTTSATITWTTDQASSSLVNYGGTTAYGSQTPNNTTLVTAHSVTLLGLTPGTTYNFDVVSANASNTSSTSGNFTFATTASSAPVISSVTATSITTTSATITWTTDQASTSLVNYGTTTGYGSQTPNNTTLVTVHSVTLTGLTPGTTFNFDVVSANASNTSATSGNFTFATTSSTAPGPVLSAEAAYPVGNTTATILWTTDQNSTSVVNYGTTTAYGQQASLGTATTIYHAVPLTGLMQGTTYNFQVASTNSSGVTTTSGNFTFTTTGTATGAGAVITAVTATAITNTSVTITWTTDQATTSQVNYGLTSSYGFLSTLNTNQTTSHSVTVAGLTPGTLYYYQVLSTNVAAITSASGNNTFLTTGSVPAPVVSSVAFWGVTSSSVIISWSTDQQANTFVTYGTTPALGQTSPVQTTLATSHGVTLTGLQPNTTYYFVANSTNSASINGSSIQFSFTTLDSGAPTVLTQVATPSMGNTATVAWTLSKAGTCQVEYGTDTSYGRWSQLTTALQTALGYVPSGTIHYRIHCMDAAGDASVTGDFVFVEP